MADGATTSEEVLSHAPAEVVPAEDREAQSCACGAYESQSLGGAQLPEAVSWAEAIELRLLELSAEAAWAAKEAVSGAELA